MSIIVCDIDNTISDASHREHFLKKSPKDWDKFFEAQTKDEPKFEIINLVEACLGFSPRGFPTVVLLTARPEKYWKQTVKWLSKYGVPYTELVMRPDGDRRDDAELKVEQIKDIEQRYNEKVWYVLEDRDRVVKALRDEGYTVLQVQEGNF